jgi:hypothetical protein
VPFTLRNLKEDLADLGSRFDGAPDLEFRLATEALELEQSGLGYQRVPPGYRFPYGGQGEEVRGQAANSVAPAAPSPSASASAARRAPHDLVARELWEGPIKEV